MTVTTTTAAGFANDADDKEPLPTPEQQAEVLEDAYKTPNTYDPEGNFELDPLRELLMEKGIPSRAETAIRSAANKKNFPLSLQFETADDTKMTTITLGELALTAQHEKATQYIYVGRIKHCLFGPHGIAKGFKLSNDIQITWRRNPLTGERESMPVITSGRHRVTAIILLLQYLGIPWQKQRIMVSTRVVDSDEDFAQLVFDNNDSRKMKVAEKRNHSLGALGIITSSKEGFYSDPHFSVRHVKVADLCAHAFAAACRFEADGKPIEYCDRLFTYAQGAFNKVVKAHRNNRDRLRSIVRGTDEDTKDLALLESTAQFVEQNLLNAISKGRVDFPLQYECHSAPKALAVLLAEHLGMVVPAFDEAK
jgi:hypothetical protein